MKAIKFFAAAALVSALALSCNSQADVKVEAELPTAAEIDTVSYLIGVNFGSFLKGNNFAEDLKENVDTTASGLQYTIISAGEEYKIQPQDTVWVNYKGTLLDGTVFDENDSTQFVANRVIKGWTEGLGLLGEGGKATLYIPSDLAYGSRGNRNIEPNSTLIFDVEVLRVGKYVPAEK